MLLLPSITSGSLKLNHIYHTDALTLARSLKRKSVNCIVTSPPYFGLRNYGHAAQIGLEPTPQEYVQALVEVFRHLRDALTDDGTLWLNLGDSYVAKPVGTFNGGSALLTGRNLSGHETSGAFDKTKCGLPEKSRMMIPARVAIALQDDGWILRDEIVWHKPNPMPESVKDRTTKAHEMIYMFSKCPQYYYDQEAIREPSKPESKARAKRGVSANHKNVVIPGQTPHSLHKARLNGDDYPMPDMRNKRSVWSVTTKPLKEAHFAAFPPDLVAPMILAGCPKGGVVLDPFMGSGTVALVARQYQRHYIGSEINHDYINIAYKRLDVPVTLEMFEGSAA